MIRMTTDPIEPDELRKQLFDAAAGAYCSFEGWIRNENEGRAVLQLEYEAYDPLALTEGEKILAEATELILVFTRALRASYGPTGDWRMRGMGRCIGATPRRGISGVSLCYRSAQDQATDLEERTLR